VIGKFTPTPRSFAAITFPETGEGKHPKKRVKRWQSTASLSFSEFIPFPKGRGMMGEMAILDMICPGKIYSGVKHVW
jgi:hypothetical protein